MFTCSSVNISPIGSFAVSVGAYRLLGCNPSNAIGSFPATDGKILYAIGSSAVSGVKEKYPREERKKKKIFLFLYPREKRKRLKIYLYSATR